MKKIAKLLINMLTGNLYLRLSNLESRLLSLESRLSNLETAFDYLVVNPEYLDSDDVGFNGQKYRKNFFRALLSKFSFEAIVETGTYYGNTTGYMAKTANVPVYTVELNSRYHVIAKVRLKVFDNITFELGDSRLFLKKLASTGLSIKNTFFYLDAHWYEDLPLEEEIEIICNNWSKFVIMIDDFKVPGDNGYGYDNYGESKSLELKTFSNIFSQYDLIPFFPAVSAEKETGNRRGCVILVKNEDDNRKKLNSIKLLSTKNVQQSAEL